MKKLFTLLTMLVVAISASWADSVTFSGTELDKDAETKTKGQVTCVSATDADDYQQYKPSSKVTAKGISIGSSADTAVVVPQSGKAIQFRIASGYKITGVSIKAVVAADVAGGTVAFVGWTNEIWDNYDPAVIKTVSLVGRNGTTEPDNVEITVPTGTKAFGLYKRIKVDNASNPTKIKLSSGANYPSSQSSFYVFSVTVNYEAEGAVDPTFSLSKASIGTDETAQINVGSKTGLDGITLSDITYGTPGIVTVDASGVVTPVAAGTTTINFSSSAVDGKYNAKTNNQVPITVTAPKYTVQYELNGGNGTAPTQADTEEGGKFNLAAAPTKDFSTFAGWLCDADNQVYAAGAEYEMTAKNTKFTAQWNVTTYSSTLDFAGETIKRAVYGSSTAPTGEKAFTNINTFLESGNMIGTSGLNNNNWEPSDEKTGYIGYKLKSQDASVKFMAKAGKKVTITFGNIAAKVTLRKNGVDSEISANSGNQAQTVVSFDADEDVLVELVTSSGGTVTLNKIAIEDAAASTNVTVGETGFATIGLPYVSTVPANVTAYTITPTSASKVTLAAVEAGATIPAYKGLIIVAEPGNYTFTQKITEGRTTYNTGTGLLATGAVTRNAAAAAGEFYYFAIINAGEKKVGFKKCAANATLAANKAYLPGALVPSGVNSLEISFDGETAINGIAESETNAEAPVKVVKNGQLFIGNYNVAGARIK